MLCFALLVKTVNYWVIKDHEQSKAKHEQSKSMSKTKTLNYHKKDTSYNNSPLLGIQIWIVIFLISTSNLSST